MSTNSFYPLLVLPTELLIRIFTHLQVADLLSVQHTCRRFHDVVSDSAFLQYILHTEINHLEALLPLDVSLHDRVALLKRHETAWKNLELNVLIQFLTSEGLRAHCYILQDGYLIYKAVILASITDTPRYGYMDLYSISDQPDAELRWEQISLAALRPLADIIFAVDHDLVVAIRSGQNGPELSFLEFTTGERHPLSSAHTVPLPKNPEVEVFGDYILVTAEDESPGSSVFSVVSWKAGTYTQLYKQTGALKALVIDPDKSLIALLESATNCIHVCRLQFVSSTTPCLETVSFLRLPGLSHRNSPSVFMSSMEWIPTSKPQDRTESQASRRRPFPFRSYRAGTIGVILRFAHQYAMFVSVEALLSVVNSGVGHVHWDGWGPTCTRILPLGPDILPRPAGPFWITCYEPLVVRDYNSLRARYIKSQEPSTHPYPPLGPSTTKMFGKHWAGGSIKTHLPFREFAARNLIFQSVLQVVADREWVVVISRTSTGQRTSFTVYHVG